MTEHADKQLVTRLLEGDGPSFDAFFSTYFPRLFRFALVRLDNDRDLAQETAQATLCKALSRMNTYRGEAALFTWLCTFCRHEIAAQQRARHRAQGDEPLVEDDPAIRSALESLLSASSLDPDIARYQSEVARLVKVTLDNLPSLYADALESKYVHDLSVRAIASRLNKSEKAIESVLTRARAAFRDSFATLIRDKQAGAGAALVIE